VAKKLALLIGVSDYGDGLEPLSAPPLDVAAVKRVLENPELGGFDPSDIKTLINPDLAEMREKIEDLFTQSSKQDLVVLYFSGHGITDDNNRLYLTTKDTSKERYRSRSVPASFIQDLSDDTYAKRQVIILDCCYSGAFAEGWRRKGDVKVELERELGKEGRVVLTSSSSTQVSFQQEDAELSLYTQYLVEGIETGAADADRDGLVKVRELHSYAKRKVQEVKPKMKPDIIVADDEGYEILVSRVKIDAESQFRQVVEECVDHEIGEILDIDLETLQVQAQRLGISAEQAQATINSVLEPFRRRQKNLKRYQEKYAEYAARRYPLSTRTLERLKIWQQEVLGLGDRDVAPIQQTIHQEKERQIAENNKIRDSVTIYPSPDKTSEPALPKSVPPPQKNAPFPPRPAPPPKQTTPSAYPGSRQTVSSPQPSSEVSLSRRQALQWLGMGGVGVLAAITIGQWQNSASNDASSSPDDSASDQEATPSSETPATNIAPGGIDYSRLEGFLKEQQWKEADQETADLMLEVANREEEGWLDGDSIRTFPCEVLSEIDRLWMQYSDRKFGFRVQSKIYFEDCGGDPSGEFDEEAWQCFGDRVGWRVTGQWIPYSQVTFDTSASAAHLPTWLGWGGELVGWYRGLRGSPLVLRYVNCADNLSL
jgi:hypothetical protein